MDVSYVKKVILYFISIVLSLLIIVYLGYHIYISFNDTIETYKIQYVTRYETISPDVYIFRNENIIETDITGMISYSCSNGEKVKKNQEIAKIYSKSNDNEELSVIDNKIDILNLSNVITEDYVTDLFNIDNKSDELFLMMRENITKGNSNFSIKNSDNLLILQNQRNIVTQKTDNYDEEILELTSKKNKILSSNGEITNTIITDKSGYFYSELDGYENIFNSSIVDTLTYDNFVDLISQDPKSYSDESIGKIVSGFDWYIVFNISAEDSRYFIEENTYDVLFPLSNNKKLDMTVYKKIEDENNGENHLIVMKTSIIPNNFDYVRKQNVNIVKETYSGMLIPMSSVRINDGIKGVYVLNGNVIRFRRIDILLETDGNCLVNVDDPDQDKEMKYEYLSKNETVVNKGKNLYDGKIIN